MKTLHCWSVAEDAPMPYIAPEQQPCRKFLRGEDPAGTGKWLTTSHIASVDGRKVTTRSGSVYKLGRIDPGYRKWLRDNGHDYYPQNPIRWL